MATRLPLKRSAMMRARQSALLVVAAADAEDVPHAALGDLRIGGGRRDHQHAVLLVHVGGRHGDAGVEVADHEFHAVGHELVGDRHAFARIGAIVADVELDFLAENAALGIDVRDRLFDALAAAARRRRPTPPVIGPPTPSLTCAAAPSANASPRPHARPSAKSFFMMVSLSGNRGARDPAPCRAQESDSTCKTRDCHPDSDGLAPPAAALRRRHV